MFSLLVSTGEWQVGQNTLNSSRFLEYTGDVLAQEVQKNIGLLERCPTIFMSETEEEGQPAAKIGSVSNIQIVGRNIRFDASFREDMPTLHNHEILRLSERLGIERFEFSRGHWAVKQSELFEVLYSHNASSAPVPTVFNIDFSAPTNPLQVSVMMPFSQEFQAVYEAIQQVSADCGMVCTRADDIWENDVVIQDVIDLISSSKIVICDCSGRNPNVFYEAGIAHTLGRNVILIAQTIEDIPFDVRHIRYVRYLNNAEGRNELAGALETRMRTLRNR